MMHYLGNYRGFCVVMVIECLVALGEMEFQGAGGGIEATEGETGVRRGLAWGGLLS